MQRNWQKAEELFICSVVAGAVVLPSVCLTLMKIYTKAGATQQAAQLLQEFLAQVCNYRISLGCSSLICPVRIAAPLLVDAKPAQNPVATSIATQSLHVKLMFLVKKWMSAKALQQDSSRHTALSSDLWILQDYTSEDKEEMAHAALEAYAKAGRHQRAIELWQSFWKNIGTTNGPAAS